ncbi:MAG: hypothetical protein U0414_09200 [Polyangiaceae bacterium]
MPTNDSKTKHSWSFFRAGGVDQVVLKTGDDIARLSELDQKLWVALACPTKGTEIGERMLDLVDTDHDGRVRPPEVLAAIEWSSKVFGKLDLLLDKPVDGKSKAPTTKIALAQINAASDEGKQVLSSAKRILKEVGKKDAKEISLDDIAAMEKALSSTRFNGDGVIPPDSAEDEAVQKVLGEIVEAVGTLGDRSGKQGVDDRLVDLFFEQAAAALAWRRGGGRRAPADRGRDARRRQGGRRDPVEARRLLRAVRSRGLRRARRRRAERSGDGSRRARSAHARRRRRGDRETPARQDRGGQGAPARRRERRRHPTPRGSAPCARSRRTR